MEKKMENEMEVYIGDYIGVRASQNYGYLCGGPHNKDRIILGSILGSPYFGKLTGSGLTEKTLEAPSNQRSTNLGLSGLLGI